MEKACVTQTQDRNWTQLLSILTAFMVNLSLLILASLHWPCLVIFFSKPFWEGLKHGTLISTQVCENKCWWNFFYHSFGTDSERRKETTTLFFKLNPAGLHFASPGLHMFKSHPPKIYIFRFTWVLCCADLWWLRRLGESPLFRDRRKGGFYKTDPGEWEEWFHIEIPDISLRSI